MAGGPKRTVRLTDHEPLKYLYSKKDLNKQQSRWIEKIVDVNPVIWWVLGKEQVLSDALSCRPNYGKCTFLIVEPHFLSNVARCTFDSTNTEMAKSVEMAAQTNSNLRIVKCRGIEVLVRITDTSEEQLVIPNTMGLHQQLLEELYCTPLSSHPGIRKQQSFYIKEYGGLNCKLP